MGKRRLFDTKNLSLSLKAVGTSIVTGLIWIIPMLVTRHLNAVQDKPVLALVFGILAITGYLFTWGFLANKIFNIRG